MDQRVVILEILKTSSVGLTPVELCKLAKERGVERPLPVIKALTSEGVFARLDSGRNGRPDRVKALPAAWEIKKKIGSGP